MRAVLYVAKKAMRRCWPFIVGARPPDLQIQFVELLPHLGGNLFAYLPRILPTCLHAGDYRLRYFCVKSERLGQLVWIQLGGHRKSYAQAFQKTWPSRALRIRCLIEHQVEV